MAKVNGCQLAAERAFLSSSIPPSIESNCTHLVFYHQPFDQIKDHCLQRIQLWGEENMEMKSYFRRQISAGSREQHPGQVLPSSGPSWFLTHVNHLRLVVSPAIDWSQL